jgi:hypothetical protein
VETAIKGHAALKHSTEEPKGCFIGNVLDSVSADARFESRLDIDYPNVVRGLPQFCQPNVWMVPQ